MSEGDSEPAEVVADEGAPLPDRPPGFNALSDDEGGDAPADADDGDGGGILGALMHTEPDNDPDDQPGGEASGHAIVGGMKVADYLGIDAFGDGGTPALINFAMAAKLLRDDLADDPDDDAERIEATDESGGQPSKHSDALPPGQSDIADL